MRLRFMRWRCLVFCGLLGCSAHTGKSQNPDDPPPDDSMMTGDEGGAPSDDGGDVPLPDGGPPAATSAIQIIVEPNGLSGKEMVNAISAAKKSVHMTMYLLTDSSVINALIGRKKAGVDVKVVLAPTLPQGSNQDVFNQLQASGVPVHFAPSSFTYTHEKTFIVDGQTAWIMTMNATYSAPDMNREFLAIDSDPGDVGEAEAIFAGDYAGTPPTAVQGKLVVAPLNAITSLLSLIQSAKSTIDIEVEELSDYRISDALKAALQRGVKVRAVLPDNALSSSGQSLATAVKGAGGRLVSVSTPYIHAKAMVIDGSVAFIGSENFSTGSLKYNRELGVIFNTPSEVQKVATTIASDFAKGTAL